MAECSNLSLLDNQGERSFPKTDLSSLFNAYELAKYNNVLNFVIGEIFRKYVDAKGWTVSDLKDSDNLQLIYQGAKAYLTNMLVEKASEQTSEWDKLSEKAMIDLDKIIENFDVFAADHAQFSNIVDVREFELEDESEAQDVTEDGDSGEDGSEDDDMEPQEANGKDFDMKGNEKSQLDLSASDTKVLFRLIPKAEYNHATKTSSKLLDNDGLPTTANFSATWNLLADKLAGKKGYKEFKDALLSPDTKMIVPEVQYLNEMLKIDKPDNQKTLSEVKQFMKFYQTFSKPKVPIKSSYLSKDGTFSLNDEILGNRQKIENILNNNFVEGNIPASYMKYVRRSPSGVYHLRTEASVPPLPATLEGRVEFLEFLGFRFSGVQYFTEDDRREFEQLVNEASVRLHTSLGNRLLPTMGLDQNLRYDYIKEPIKEMKRRKSRLIPSEFDAINKLINFESRWSRVVPTHSSRNAAGELQHLIMNDSALSIGAYYLNKSDSLEEVYRTPFFSKSKYNPLFKTSYITKFLFDEFGIKRPGRGITLELLSGDKQSRKGKDKVKLERDMSEREKLIQDYNNFLLHGRTDVMRTETSHSFYMIGLYNGSIPFKYVNAKAFPRSFFENKAFRDQVVDYLKGELERIKSYPKVKEENPAIPSAYADFSIFSEIFEVGNQELKSRLLTQELTPDLIEEFLIEYEKVLNAEVGRLKSLLNKNGITYTELFSKQVLELKQEPDALHRAFVAGTLMQNIEFSILYTGDTLFYKDMHKRLKGLSSTGSIAADLPLLEEYFNTSEAISFFERYSLHSAMNVKRRDNSSTFRTQTLKEYGVRKGNGYLSKELSEHIQRSVIIRDGSIGKYTDEYIKNDLLKNAADQKPADGQGYINMDFHREVGLRFGFWDENMEIAYKYEGLIFRRDILNKTLSDAEAKELKQLEKQIYNNPDKYAMPVIKMTYWGNIHNTTVDAKAYDKFSTAPLLPSDVRNHAELKEIMMDMVKGNYGYVKYESGTKLFKTSTPADLKSAEPDLYYTPLLKEQIKTNSKQKVETSIPTQLLKLIFANLFDEGKPKTERTRKLFNKYLDTLSKIQKEQISKVLTDLGFDFSDGDNGVQINSIDMEVLSSKLIREAKRQQLNSNIINSLIIDKITKRFVVQPEASGFNDQISNLVAGIMDKTLRRFKFPGGDFVLITNANRSQLPWYKFSEEGTSAIGIRITLTKEYSKLLNKVHPDGDRIGTIERLNKLLRNDEWVKENKKALTVILDRVPTDGPHSADFAIVHEFLSPTMGNVVILPDEITLKSGTDFDYDKEKTITPNLDSNGNYLSEYNEDRAKQLREKINELQDIYPELKRLAQAEEEDNYDNLINNIFRTNARKELFRLNREANQLLEEYFNLTGDIAAIKNNQIIEIYAEALSLPEMYVELISPNSAAQVLELADKNADNTGKILTLPKMAKVFYYTENLKVYKTFFDAKNMLSMFAKDNTFQQLFTYQGININDSYNIRVWSMKDKDYVWIPEKITNILLSDSELAKITSGKKIRTSLREDIDGFVKQHWNSEGINATVDAAKDPRFALLGINIQNINVVMLLKTVGVPFERIIDFINHPALQKYFSIIESGATKNAALEQMAKDRFLFRSATSTEEMIKPENLNMFLFSSEEDLRQKGLLKDDQSVGVNQFGRRDIYKKGPDSYIRLTGYNYPGAFSIKRILKQIHVQNKVTEHGFEYINKWLNNLEITPERLKFLARPENERTVVRRDPNRSSERIPLYSDELRLFAFFKAMEDVSFAFGDFRKYYNFDTSKVSSNIEVRLKDNLRKKIEMTNMFSSSDLYKMDTQSIIAPFINKDIIKSAFDMMFPILGNQAVQSTLTSLYEKYSMSFQIRNKRDLRNMPRQLADDFITSVVFTYGKVDGKNLFENGIDLLIKNKVRPTMVERMIKFREQPYYKDIVNKFPVLERFISNKQLVNDPYDLNGLKGSFIIENIQFIKNPNDTLLEQEEVIEQLRDLYFNYIYDESTKEENDKINAALKSFLKDLFLAGLIQSGISRTSIGYSEYIPLEWKQDIFKNALSEFEKLTAVQTALYLSEFQYKFMNNNPRYFPSYKKRDATGRMQTLHNNNSYSNRLKFYHIRQPRDVYSEVMSTKDMEQKIELLFKIKELAMRGIEGERANAVRKYNEAAEKNSHAIKLWNDRVEKNNKNLNREKDLEILPEAIYTDEVPYMENTTPPTAEEIIESVKPKPQPKKEEAKKEESKPTIKDKLEKALKVAEGKFFMTSLREYNKNYYFINFDADPEIVKVYKEAALFDTERGEDLINKYSKLITPENFATAVEQVKKYGNDVLFDDMVGEISMKTIIQDMSKIELNTSETSYIEYDSIKDVYKDWVNDRFDNDYQKEEARKLLTEYGLGSFLAGYNPNQLSLFPETEEEKPDNTTEIDLGNGNSITINC